MYHRTKSLRDMPEDLKPREKMLSLGAEKLSEEELLAIVLGSGTKDMDVLSLSREIVKMGWKELFQLSPQELMKRFKGIGEAKACQIKAILELAKRISDPYEGVFINNPEDAYSFLKSKVDERREHLICLYLSPTNRLISYEIIAIGRMNALHAEPKEILYHAINIFLSSYYIFKLTLSLNNSLLWEFYLYIKDCVHPLYIRNYLHKIFHYPVCFLLVKQNTHAGLAYIYSLHL